MKVILDDRKVRHRALLSHAASLGGLLAVLGSVALSLWRPDLHLLQGALLGGGVMVAAVGIYFANRWVRKPRPEEALAQALRGLDDRHRLYLYLSKGPAHLLLTPAGVVALEVNNLAGLFTYREGKWRERMTLGRAMRYFLEEPLGDPVARARAGARWLQAYLARQLPPGAQVPVQGLVVFIHPLAQVDLVDRPPIPVCTPRTLRKKLPKFPRRLPEARYEQVVQALDELAGGVR
jgi:hypothetical protein